MTKKVCRNDEKRWDGEKRQNGGAQRDGGERRDAGFAEMTASRNDGILKKCTKKNIFATFPLKIKTTSYLKLVSGTSRCGRNIAAACHGLGAVAEQEDNKTISSSS